MDSPTPVLHGGPVVIIGGGVVGLSIAYHLALRGHGAVTVVERHALGSGITSKGVGGVRQQFSSAINIALSRRAVDYFASFDERVGGTIGYRRHGFLFLIDNERQWAVFNANVERQRAAGVPVEVLAPEEIAAVMPGIALDGLIGATYCPTDGSATPALAVHAFARRARDLGARLLESTAATAIERDGTGAVAAVQTIDGRLEAEVVVNAAGPWAAEIGRMAGVELPIEPRARQAFAIDAPVGLTPDLPFTIDLGSGAYIQPRANEAVIGGIDRAAAPGFREEVDWSVTPPLLAALTRRMPALGSANIRRGWVGARDMTADDHAIVGPISAAPGFWVAAGFSGHGFVHAPVIGELLAQWLIEGAPDLDLSPLRFDRFQAGRAAPEAVIF